MFRDCEDRSDSRAGSGRRLRSGQALIEFAIVALVLLVLFLAFADIGFGLFNGQIAVESARIAGREAQTSANVTTLANLGPGGPADYDFTDPAVAPTNDFDRLIFRRCFAAIQVDPVDPVLDAGYDTSPNDGKLEGSELDAIFELLPPGNRALRPAMRVDFVTRRSGATVRMLHLPGTLMERSDGVLTVWAPEVTDESDAGDVDVFLREIVQIETPDNRGQFTVRVNLIHTFLDVLVLPKTFANTFSLANLTSTGEPTPVGAVTVVMPPAANAPIPTCAFATSRQNGGNWTGGVLLDGLGTLRTRATVARPQRMLLRGATVARAESP